MLCYTFPKVKKKECLVIENHGMLAIETCRNKKIQKRDESGAETE